MKIKKKQPYGAAFFCVFYRYKYIYFGSHEDINSLNEITKSFYHPDDSRILKCITFGTGHNNILIDKYKYNRKMQLIKIKHYRDNKLTDITKYKYKSLESK